MTNVKRPLAIIIRRLPHQRLEALGLLLIGCEDWQQRETSLEPKDC